MKQKWIKAPELMDYDAVPMSRNSHSYKTMWEDQKKTNKGLLIALGLTVITAYGLMVGTQMRFKHELEASKQAESKCMSAYLRSEGAYNEVLGIVLNSETKSPEAIINTVFGKDAPLMTKIAYCESHLNPNAKNKVSSATGLFQVMSSVHQVNEKWLKDATINTLIAKKLFDASGTNPWISSASCWNK